MRIKAVYSKSVYVIFPKLASIYPGGSESLVIIKNMIVPIDKEVLESPQ